MDGPFYFNGQLFDMNRIDYQIPLDNIEIWTIINLTMVAHPFHLHGMQFFVLDRDAITVQPQEAGYKDVVMIAPNESVRFITKFEDFPDTTMPYMYHCHILMHEDDGMMGQYVIVPTITGVDENSNKTVFSAYPNPATDQININFSSNGIKRITLSDFSGRIVYQRQISDEKMTISLENTIEVGMYLLSVQLNSKSYSKKFSIVH